LQVYWKESIEMPRPRFQKLDRDKQARILEAAAREFSVHGYDGASLNHILAAAGISKGAAYYYFDDKADLFGTVVHHYLDHVIEEAEFDLEDLSAESYWPKVLELADQMEAHVAEMPWVQGLAKAIWRMPRGEVERGPLGEILRPLWAWLREIVVRGQALGVVRRDLPVDLLVALIVAMDEAGDRWLAENWEAIGDVEARRVLLEVVRCYRRVCEPRED
jgi:AcrR family transcriptional regulator